MRQRIFPKPALLVALAAVSAFLFSFAGCSRRPSPAPLASHPVMPDTITQDSVIRYLQARKTIELPALTPGKNYPQDPSERDVQSGDSVLGLHFTKVELRPADEQAPGKVMAKLRFLDTLGNTLDVGPLNLLDLINRIELKGELQYADFLLKEFERFGVIYYKKENEFALEAKDPRLAERAYQAGLFNNCLDPGKWELVLSTKYYQEYDKNHASPKEFQRYRVLAHTWFQFDPRLYAMLMRLANPGLAVDPFLSYAELTNRAEAVRIPFGDFGRIKRPLDVKVLEIGHKSKRELHELDEEESFKFWRGLVVNRGKFHTYDDVLATPVKLAKFAEQGFYDLKDPVSFDYGWMRRWDKVEAAVVDTGDDGRFLRFRITGDQSPYELVLGNFDMGRLNSGRFVNMPFGNNPMPKSRLNRKGAYSTSYNLGPKGKGINPYMFLIEKRTGRFLNNQVRGLEQMFLTWQSQRRDALMLYLVSYERMLPVWMARISLGEDENARDRIANAFYSPKDTALYPARDFVEVRKARDSVRSLEAGAPPGSDTARLGFDAYGFPDNKLHVLGYSVDESGFTIQSGGLLGASPFRTVGAKGFAYTGSPALVNGGKAGVNYVSRRLERIPDMLDYTRNRRFDAVSVDLAAFDPGSGPAEVTFVGVKKDSSTVSETFRVPPEPMMRTYRFGPSFKEIYTLRWLANTLQFDNIVLAH